MDSNQIKKELVEILGEWIDIRPININMPLNDYGLDSLDSLEMGLEIENRFNINLSTEELRIKNPYTYLTLQEITNYISREYKKD